MPKLFRCSSLADLIGNPKGKGEFITETAKSKIRATVKEDLYGFKSFTGNQYTNKGLMLEDIAIEMSGKMRFKPYKKHVGRIENELITGECDILDFPNKLIIDTKCTWDIGTHIIFSYDSINKNPIFANRVDGAGYIMLNACNIRNRKRFTCRR